MRVATPKRLHPESQPSPDLLLFSLTVGVMEGCVLASAVFSPSLRSKTAKPCSRGSDLCELRLVLSESRKESGHES